MHLIALFSKLTSIVTLAEVELRMYILDWCYSIIDQYTNS